MEHHDAVESKFAGDHLAAVKSMTAERYVLGEMESAEIDAFEEHFFDCVECSDDVRDETKIADGVRMASSVAEPANHLTRWAVAAGAVIAVSLGYLYLDRHVPSSIGQPARVAAAEQPIELESVRGAGDVRKVRADQPVALYFVIPPEHALAIYTCELRDAAEERIVTMPVSQTQARDTVKMPVPSRTLRSGRYKVVILGGDREIAEYPFTVEVK
jgi:hypothetical protein